MMLCGLLAVVTPLASTPVMAELSEAERRGKQVFYDEGNGLPRQ